MTRAEPGSGVLQLTQRRRKCPPPRSAIAQASTPSLRRVVPQIRGRFGSPAHRRKHFMRGETGKGSRENHSEDLNNQWVLKPLPSASSKVSNNATASIPKVVTLALTQHDERRANEGRLATRAQANRMIIDVRSQELFHRSTGTCRDAYLLRGCHCNSMGHRAFHRGLPPWARYPSNLQGH